MKKVLMLFVVMSMFIFTGCEQKSEERKQCESFVKSLGGSAAEADEECSDY